MEIIAILLIVIIFLLFWLISKIDDLMRATCRHERTYRGGDVVGCSDCGKILVDSRNEY